MTKIHPLFHRLKSVIGYSVAIAVIIIALGVSGLRLLLTTANLYQAEVEQLATSLLNQPVKIGRMDARLSGLIPTLIFHDVQLVSKKTKKNLVSLAQIDVGISVEDLVWSRKITPIQLTVRGMNVHVTRTVEGNIKIKGVDFDSLNKVDNEESNSLLERWLSQQSEVGVEDSIFIWKDEQNGGLTWFFDDISLLLKNTAERHQLLLSSNLPNQLGDKVKVAFDLEGNITKPESWQARVFVESKNINLAPLQKYIKNTNFELLDGVADLKLWADWGNNKVKQLSGNVKLQDFSYRRGKNKQVRIKLVSGIFDSQQDNNNNWNISVDKFNYVNSKNILNEAGFSLAFNYKNNQFNKTFVKTNDINLESLSDIITSNYLFDRKNENTIKSLNLYGKVDDFYIALQNNEIDQLQASFSNAGINSWKGIPKLAAVSGNINYKDKKGSIELHSKNSVIGFPNLFREDFKLDEISANVLFSNSKEGLLFEVEDLLTKNIEVTAASKAMFWIPKDDSSPYLDLQTYVSQGDVSKISHFLPVTIMDDSLVKWLDNGIVDGKVEKSTIIFNGKLDEFPFDNQEGKFSVDVDASDVIIDYQKHWPKITKADIKANFTGQGMDVFIPSGEVKNNLLYNSSAKIKSFSKAELKLNLIARGSAHDTMTYLTSSPILSSAKNTIKQMRLSGDVVTDIDINIPLDDEIRKIKPITYSGSADLNDTSLFMLNDRIDITNGNGEIYFTEKSFSSKNLSANIFGEKSIVSVSSIKNNKVINISANSKIDPGKILKKFNIPGANKISGKTKFNALMSFPEKNVKKHPRLILTTDLLGVKSKLPESFYKTEKKPQKFKFETVFLGGKKILMDVEFGKKSSAIFELDQSGKDTILNKGAISISSKKADLPRKNILYIDGSINKFTPSKWMSALELGKTKKPQSFFINPVVFNLDKLNILTTDKGNENSQHVSKPQKLPVFEGIVKKLYFNKINLGRIDFKSSKNKKGLHLDELIVSSKNMKLFAHGDWYQISGKHTTKLKVTLSSHNFGSMLTDLGFSSVVDKGVAKMIGTLNWNGAPTQYSLDRLNGDIQLNLEKGSIKDVDAGAGRLLGLFSLSALPRKLMGDFKDSFDKGFNFDTANGDINITNGDAYTDEFEVNSPVATISISGRTGLADKDYENIVEVVPKVGSGVAGITALLVNLPAGIGVWLLDKLTGEQFNEASSTTYEINGTWEKPKIEEIVEEEL